MITEKNLAELSVLLEKKEISSTELTRACLERIEKLNPSMNAFITVTGDEALKAAQKSDERRKNGAPLSPYDGIPIAIKDNINTKGVRTTCASRMLENYIPPFDAAAFENVSAKGFILIGKTNMDEFAMGSTTELSYFGATKNPFDLERVSGGSSGGSAAAIAARMIPAALGSDTGGSIRQPAAFCGVVGVKPTYGRVSRHGLAAFASSLDQIGTLARDINGAAALLKATAGEDKRDGTSASANNDFSSDITDDIKGMIIGVPDEYFKGIDSDVSSAVMNKAALLEKKGARLEKISLKYTEYAIPAYCLIAATEGSSNLSKFDGLRYGYHSKDASDLDSLYLKSRGEGFGKEVKRRIILGTFASSSGYYDAYYLKALKVRSFIINDFKNAFSKVDAIISPAAARPAFKLGEITNDLLQMYMADILTVSANLTGIPAISVPIALSTEGLPIGFQIMANHFDEKKLFRVARSVEEESEPLVPKL